MIESAEIPAELTDAQRAAVTHVDGPLLILAGPGSGKTRVVTHRIAHLLSRGVPAGQIVALTFTNKAADEMRTRVERLAPGEQVWLGTFHRFCAQLLRKYAAYVGLDSNYSIYDAADSAAEVKRAMEERGLDAVHVTPDRVARAISAAKSSFITPELYTPALGSAVDPLVNEIYPLYQRRLLQANAVDFDDLLLHVARLLKENADLRSLLDARFRYILVDEYQDTNLAQYAIVRALSQDYPNLAVTGDPDQSIYGWRGANLNNILEFERDYPQVQVVRLEQNYRSTQRIVHVASELIARNTRRKHKDLFTANDPGQPVRLVLYPSAHDEARDLAERIARGISRGQFAARDCAILYRTNALSRTVEQALAQRGLPYQIVKGLEFYQRKEIKDVLAYLCLLNNPRDDRAVRRIINLPQRGIGEATIERLDAYARRKQLSLLAAAREAGLIEGLSKRAAVAAAKFVSLIDRLNLHVHEPVESILRQVLAQSGYADMLRASDDPEDGERLANVEELQSAAQEFDVQHAGHGPLEAFLEQHALVNDVDGWEGATDKVTLMTLHAAKGLEFSRVFIIGLEEGILPHERSRHDHHQLEEERRLLFVGITRARHELQLSHSERRARAGEARATVPSQFLMELPRGEMQMIGRPAAPWSDPHCQLDPWEEGSQPANPATDKIEFSEITPALDAPADPPAAPRSARIRTAAEQFGGGEPARAGGYPPEVFRAGMVVTHPEHGLGKITSLSGEGKNRRANVQFFTPPNQGTFVLAYSKLAPAGG